MKRMALLLMVMLLGACSDDSGTSSPNTPDNSANAENNTSMPDAGADAEADTAVPEEDMPLIPGKLEISDTLVTFEGVMIDDSQTATIAITNTGGESLLVTDAVLGEIDRQGESEFTKGEWLDGATILEGGTFLELEVVYAPNDYDTDRGTLTIETNDPDNPTFEVRFETLNPYRDIDVPRFFRFGAVDLNTEKTERIFVYNRGGQPLQIDNIAYAGLGEFSLDFSVNSNQPSFPIILERGEAYAIDVTYAPTADETDRGTITITSNDPDEATLDIALTGNEPGPCLKLTPQILDFGEVATSATQTVSIFNCSDSDDLEIGTLEVSDDGGGVFTLSDAPGLPTTINPFQTADFDVTAVPDEGERIGEVTVATTDNASSAKIELRARVPEQ